MQGHGLMQAIARVNRVFKDKPGGLVVDYLGLADALKLALAEYTKGDQEEAGVPQEQAVAIMLEKFEVVQALFFGFDYSRFFTGTPSQRLAVMPAAMEHILTLEDGKKRFLQAVTELSKAFVLAVPHEEAIKRREEVSFFQAIRAAFVKATPTDGKTHEDLDTAVRQIVSKAVTAGEVIDIYATLGVQQPNIALLSDEFLEEVKDLPQKNLALELLRKLVNDQIKVRMKRNVVEARTFGERLDEAVRRYQNHSIEAAQVIAEVIELAKDIRIAQGRGATLGLSEEELAFYDALGVNDSAVQIMGDQTLKLIAHELVQAIRNSVTIDWTVKESVRAKIRTVIKRLLRKYKYPPDMQEKAVQTIVEQAEALCKDWAA
jgi:type I restriction enzyme R subunit